MCLQIVFEGFRAFGLHPAWGAFVRFRVHVVHATFPVSECHQRVGSSSFETVLELWLQGYPAKSVVDSSQGDGNVSG